MKSKWEKAGTIGVDAGVCWIGDPCYILHTDSPKEIGKDWEEFCNILESKQKNGTAQFDYDLGHPGLGFCVGTGYGDGEYPIYVKRNNEGRIMQVMVSFDDAGELKRR